MTTRLSRITVYRDRVFEECHSLFFPVHSPGHGYGFDCDAAGNVDVEKLPPAARANFDMCQRDHAGIADIRSWTSERTIPGEMECDCGKKLQIWDWRDLHCPCGRSYNSAGSLLAPRSQWGEETGETASDYDRGLSEADAD